MRTFNLVRYILSLLLLAGSFFLYPALCVPAILLLLLVNNCLDDVVFYRGSKDISPGRYRGGVACPVNGVVTCIEKDVPLMTHIRKCDCLDDKILLELDREAQEDEGRLYNHVTIFLNKFNCHAVTNPGSAIVRELHYDKDGELISMVEAGEMTTTLNGRFLNNSFIRTEYEDGTICVYTLDKYVSKMIASPGNGPLGVDYFICRGSQCDIYLPSGREFCVARNQILRNLQTISEGPRADASHDYASEAGALIARDSCARAGHILLSNLRKTLSTYSFRNPFVLAALLAALCIGPLWGGCLPALVLVELLTGFFALDRFCKNLLYAVFNLCGYKPRAAALYKKLHWRL